MNVEKRLTNARKSLRKRLTATGLATLVVLAALCWTAAPPTRAKGPLQPRAKGSVLRVGPPVSFKNLTLFPVYTLEPREVEGYLTLDEGLKDGTVVITEKGSARATRRAGGRRVVMRDDDSDDVNQLTLINRSGRKLLLLAGEVVVGGKQDRIIQEDLIVPPVNVPVSLNVFCVEHGRWSPREMASARADAGTQGAYPAPSIVAPVAASNNFASLGAISHPKLRAAAQDKKEQEQVWKEVSDNNERLRTQTSTDTYQEVYNSPEVGATVEQYVAALRNELRGRNVVGVVVARNGEVVWSDHFASPSLFARYWPKLLKSYVIDAIGDRQSERRPTLEQATRYFYEGGGRVSARTRAGVFRLYKTESPRFAIFHLYDLSLARPVLVHVNKMEREAEE